MPIGMARIPGERLPTIAEGAIGVGRIRVLHEDPELGALEGPRAVRAVHASVANVVDLRAGEWRAADDAALAREGYGLLILDGILIRRVGVDGRFGAELLAKGDLLRPW